MRWLGRTVSWFSCLRDSRVQFPWIHAFGAWQRCQRLGTRARSKNWRFHDLVTFVGSPINEEQETRDCRRCDWNRFDRMSSVIYLEVTAGLDSICEALENCWRGYTCAAIWSCISKGSIQGGCQIIECLLNTYTLHFLSFVLFWLSLCPGLCLFSAYSDGSTSRWSRAGCVLPAPPSYLPQCIRTVGWYSLAFPPLCLLND